MAGLFYIKPRFLERGYSPTPRKSVGFEAVVKFQRKVLSPPTPQGVKNKLKVAKETAGEHLP
jgi:hypothetical protein